MKIFIPHFPDNLEKMDFLFVTRQYHVISYSTIDKFKYFRFFRKKLQRTKNEIENCSGTQGNGKQKMEKKTLLLFLLICLIFLY